ncbi:MAG: hypothetical protein ACK4SM_05855 [Aquificaceae bacterium]
MKVLNKAWQLFSLLLVAYGFYLLFLFLLDTLLRVNRELALPLSLLITLASAGFVVVFWIKKKRLPF